MGWIFARCEEKVKTALDLTDRKARGIMGFHMKRFGALFFTSLFGMSFLGCVSKMVIQSEPSQAEIYARVEGKGDRILLGQTPLEISETQLADKLSLSADSIQWVQLVLEKKEYGTREVFLPSNRWGERSKVIKLTLSANPDKSTIVREMLSRFFNAKKFAETKQFDQAHSEIDKVLTLDSQSVKALNMKAGIYFLEAKWEEAKRLYRKALEIDPSSSDAIKMLEKLQNREGMK